MLPPASKRMVKTGRGWRLGWDPEAPIYQGLVGTEDWGIELTRQELADFCRLLQQLHQTMEQMSKELMDEERISCEAETDVLWLEVEGYPHSYSLRLLLNQSRRCEGYWDESVVLALLQATQTLGLS